MKKRGRPPKFFDALRPAKKAAKARGHKLWEFIHDGYLGAGYFVGKKLPQKITVTTAIKKRIKLERGNGKVW